MIYLDCETVGFHGMAVLLQYAKDDGPIILHSIWTQPIKDTLELIEQIVTNDIVGFNLAFDWFHLCKLHTIFSLIPDKDQEPIDCIEQIAEMEPMGRDGLCLKPKSAMDLMLHARKGPYQSTMDRKDIRIKKIPTALAWQLAAELEKRVPLKDIYFARRKDKYQAKWQVYDILDDDDEVDPNFKDIVLKFAPSSALKALAVDALGIKEDALLRFTDVEVDRKYLPVELGYAPFARAIGNRHDWKGAWPEVIRHHISHWTYNDLARKYAANDVDYTRRLYIHFGSPPLGDDDSILACMVAAVRWKGFAIDVQKMKELREKTIKSKTKIVNGKEFTIPTSPAQARFYVSELMDETELLGATDSINHTYGEFQSSTKKVILQAVAKWKKECPLCDGGTIPDGEGLPTPYICPQNGCVKGFIPHPAAERAQDVLNARDANYMVTSLYDKLILAGRFHASFVVIGTLSSRMAGTDDFNAQGIKKTKEVRSCFPLAFADTILCGGDFAGFEVTLAEACYNDPRLRKDLQTGKKIHALFGVHVFPDMTYEEILATESTKDDRYTRCKQAVFAMFYGGEGFTLRDRLGVDIETADKAYALFCKVYPQVGVARRKVFDMFCSMRQPKGIGTKVEWHEPSDYIESMFGFRRYFTLENTICKALFTLANQPPKEWRDIKIRVQRRDRQQTASGAVQSALYAAAFGMQAANMRAAANHVIQSSGGQITKLVQRKIWDLQPCGIHEWVVQPMNIHDEIMCPTNPQYTVKLKEVVDQTVETLRPKVPLIKMDWVTGLKSWADKG